ncbi:MAG: AzlD domain-containing protein [Lachnospiraceae bacterium]|nr:AzlD domain-containing protein [Ruminococcus sp.]MCM1274306.1 AzlD domain-containing protein [Lachnospiraceae bacterium]
MSDPQIAAMIAAVAVGTMLTRFLPFLVFGGKKTVPKYVEYLGKALTGAALGLLAVYGFKGVNVLEGSHGLPELIALAVIIALHVRKRNMLLSIAAGTALYMVLVNFVF